MTVSLNATVDAGAVQAAADRESMINDSAFARLWRGFMTARVMIALVLLLLLGSLYGLGHSVSPWLVLFCVTYLVGTIAVRVLTRPGPTGRAFDPQWVFTIGVDVVAYSWFHYLQLGNLNFTPLFALPVLLASVLGSGLLALATAAGIALLLLADAWWMALQFPADTASRFLQAGLTGSGFFLLALLTQQLASRLAREELLARRSVQAARLQAEVNQLVIETLADGILVVDGNGVVRAVNPAAQRLLEPGAISRRPPPFLLAAEAAWQPLVTLSRRTFVERQQLAEEVDIAVGGALQFKAYVRTRLTVNLGGGHESLCVMFLQDLREMEARVRTEKLAAMGRMSVAVAHEIRNPLAAISQANALLEEDLADPALKRFSALIAQNAARLARIVDDVLDVSRARQAPGPQAVSLALDRAVADICTDWESQASRAGRITTNLTLPDLAVLFEQDHLRRVLVNLLDNAERHASGAGFEIRVDTALADEALARLSVWTPGPPIEQGVQRHLFEPFFSSQSRSTGLGLYLCRELCERHSAAIGYQRSQRADMPGNEFFVLFRPVAHDAAGVTPAATIEP
ncbi:MAG: PAS domain-containing protein [Ramlibacter sp.]|jgi:two-component system sensor histidine kinase PilS (NtrC family)|nr:PAS domain-containing protein [Ramlibacter sp.]